MSRRPLIWCAATLAALPVLAGCELRADVELEVDADGGGELSVTLETDRALDEEARAAGFDLVETVERQAAELDGWEATTGQREVRLSTEFDDPDELRQVSGGFAEALAGPELEPLEPFEVLLTDERVSVEGAAALQPTGEVAAAGLGPEEATSLLDEGVTYRVALVMPGEVLRHNADRVEGERLVWRVPAGERVDIMAESERPREPPLPLLAAALAAAVAGVVLLVVARRRRRRRRWRF